jgi:hypothetical protein
MIEFLKSLLLHPSAESLMQKELEQAKRELLAAQTAADYAINITQYHRDRIDRLKLAISKEVAE